MSRKRARRLANAPGNDKQKTSRVSAACAAARITNVLSLKYSSYVGRAHTLSFLNYGIEHLYHTTGWSRELWIQSLGLPAVIPPPEEEKDVKTAIGAARAKQSRKEML